MGPVLLRYLLDAFYIVLFFAIMSGAAYGVHWIVERCEEAHIDRIELMILRAVAYLSTLLDSIGVVTATTLLTFRFVRAIARTDD